MIDIRCGETAYIPERNIAPQSARIECELFDLGIGNTAMAGQVAREGVQGDSVDRCANFKERRFDPLFNIAGLICKKLKASGVLCTTCCCTQLGL